MPILNSDDPGYAGRFGEFDSHPLMRAYHKYVKFRYVIPLAKLLTPDSSILDIGCGAGRFLLDLREVGYRNIAGMELRDIRYDALKDDSFLRFYQGSVLDDALCAAMADENGGGFDVVFLQSLLHHLPFEEIFHAVDNACRMCRGTIVICEPNPVSFVGKMVKNVYCRYFYPENYRELVDEMDEMVAVAGIWPRLVGHIEAQGFTRVKMSTWTHSLIYLGRKNIVKGVAS